MSNASLSIYQTKTPVDKINAGFLAYIANLIGVAKVSLKVVGPVVQETQQPQKGALTKAHAKVETLRDRFPLYLELDLAFLQKQLGN